MRRYYFFIDRQLKEFSKTLRVSYVIVFISIDLDTDGMSRSLGFVNWNPTVSSNGQFDGLA